MVKCSFCGKDEAKHKGLHLIRNDGGISYFCSSKCRKNTLNLKRDSRKIRWAEAFHIVREKARVKAAEKKAEKVSGK
jgi:large subunit ribosomal protein L24e